MLKKDSLIFSAIIFFAVPVAAAEFAISFEWGDIPLCTTGNPNTVPNPKFVLSNIPEGTKFIQFKLTELDVKGFGFSKSVDASQIAMLCLDKKWLPFIEYFNRELAILKSSEKISSIIKKYQ